MAIKDVQRDGNCLLWAVIVSYLEQVKTNKNQFKTRYKSLFGIEVGWERIFNFADFNFADKENEKLVKVFRNRICDYIETKLDTKRPDNKANFRSMLLESEINKKNKESYPNNSEDTQIRKTLEQMRKNGEITGSVEIEAICNILNCNIIRINEDFDVASRERFEPDNNVIANNEVKLYYQARHYQYFSNVTNQTPTKRNEEETTKVVTPSFEVNSNNNSSQESILFPREESADFLINARLKLKNQLSDKEINEETQNAIIDIFIEDIIKVPAHQKNEILEKSIFELNNQDQLFTNPNLVFESFIKPIINGSKTGDQQLLKESTNANTN